MAVAVAVPAAAVVATLMPRRKQLIPRATSAVAAAAAAVVAAAAAMIMAIIEVGIHSPRLPVKTSRGCDGPGKPRWTAMKPGYAEPMCTLSGSRSKSGARRAGVTAERPLEHDKS